MLTRRKGLLNRAGKNKSYLVQALGGQTCMVKTFRSRLGSHAYTTNISPYTSDHTGYTLTNGSNHDVLCGVDKREHMSPCSDTHFSRMLLQ